MLTEEAAKQLRIGGQKRPHFLRVPHADCADVRYGKILRGEGEDSNRRFSKKKIEQGRLRGVSARIGTGLHEFLRKAFLFQEFNEFFAPFFRYVPRGNRRCEPEKRLSLGVCGVNKNSTKNATTGYG
jgi:hypothetical protein